MVAQNALWHEAKQRSQDNGSLWRRAFATSKEERWRRPPSERDRPSGQDSLTGGNASLKRLLQSLRSHSPGGWSDDRFEQSRHFVGIAYTAIHRIGIQLSQAEFRVYRKDDNHPDGKRPIMPDDPPEGDRVVKPYKLVELLERPNWRDSFGKIMYRLNQQKALTGQALIWSVMSAAGVPMELYVMPTALMVPQPTANPRYPDGYYRVQPYYPYGPWSSYPTPMSAAGAELDSRHVIQFQNPHPLLFWEGYSPLTAMRMEMDEFESISKSRWYTMKRTFRPSVVLNFKDAENMNPLPEEEVNRIHAEFENSFQGPENAGKMIVGAPGSELVEFGAHPIDMDYPNSWEQLLSFLLGGGFGITKPAAGMIEDSSYSTLFATMKQLHMVTLDPECADYAAVLTRRLAPLYGDDLVIEIRCKRIDDHDVRNANLNVLITAKAITKNEVRKELDMEVTQEPWGQEIAGVETQPQAPPGMEGQGMQVPGQPGQAPAQAQGPGGLPEPPQLQNMPGGGAQPEMANAPEIENTRPSPGNLGRGALGPRKHRLNYRFKMLDALFKETVNGKH